MNPTKFLAALAAAFVLFAAPSLVGGARAQTGAGAIEVRITGLHNTDGVVRVCLWREGQADAFPRCDRGRPVQTLSAPATAPVVGFADVAPGVYAISFFHDERNTGAPRTNMVGMATSAVGVSNNPPISLTSPPNFDRSKFTVSAGAQTALTISALYPFGG